jgi:hypothetical protein
MDFHESNLCCERGVFVVTKVMPQPFKKKRVSSFPLEQQITAVVGVEEKRGSLASMPRMPLGASPPQCKESNWRPLESNTMVLPALLKHAFPGSSDLQRNRNIGTRVFQGLITK